MDVKQMSLDLHKEYKGEIKVEAIIPVTNKEELSLAYTPGVAAPCLEIAKNKEKAYDYTLKGRSVAVISNGTAVLGLGDIGAFGSLPVIEGKALLHKSFAGTDAYPIAIDATDKDEIVNVIKAISPGFAGIHLEDIKAPECFYIEDKLKEVLDIPVYHDDQHGTAISVLAGLYNGLRIVNKNIEDIKVVIDGAGASGIAIANLLLSAGVKDIVLCDINGALIEGDKSLNKAQEKIAKLTNRNFETGYIEDLIKGKDVFIGVCVGNVVTTEMIKTMNKDSMVFALANPIPEILPKYAKLGGARITATGRGDFKNQMNNLLVFPGLFKGLLEGRIKNINDDMKLEVAKAIASLVKDDELNEDYILPSVFNREVVQVVSQAVIKFKDK
ncbi:MAG: NADP-dependent malic enzyme [Sarcina ventriculi]|uniref:NAD(P)-dependent malic enzyme n=1 Tax=Sarcina ventriculi TaxID=1267 RepID=UPI002AA143E1|nr:NADP-dependent malic enzyme [Sarcina ventriculi]MCI5636222.1 NADP-dependent malic enzyme [Sarcina ventriculi]MDY7061811.1 NADP-dependent malic enzyme [Sarcina ventriculi]